MFDKYLGLTPEEFAALYKRNKHFQENLNDPTKEPVVVFSKISQKSFNELSINREVTKDLQKKKEEDMKKKEAEEKEVEEKAEEKTEDNAEENKPEPENEK